MALEGNEINSVLTDKMDDTEKDRKFVTALARGLEILSCFRFEDHWLGNSDIVEKTGLPKATVSRLTYTLMKLGYLRHSNELGKYKFGPEFLSIGCSFLSRLKVREVARPLMQALTEYSQGAVNLAVREGLNMVYIDTYRSTSNLLIQLNVGTKLPIHSSALGKAYLNALPENDREELIQRIRHQNKENWQQIEVALNLASEEFNKYGYCTSFGEWRAEINAVGVPLVLEEGLGIFAFSCGAPSFQFAEPRVRDDIAPRLVNLVRNVKTALLE